MHEQYLQGYAKSYKEWCEEKQSNCVAELLVRPNGMGVPDPYALLRIDMASNLNKQFSGARFEPNIQSSLIPKKYQVTAKLTATVSPIVWSRVEFLYVNESQDKSRLTSWTNKWLDPSDSKHPIKGGFSGVVHSVTYPVKQAGTWRILVDFGSSGTEAFFEILQTLEAMGVREVQIRSSTNAE